MKLNKDMIKHFEYEQKKYGTEIAIHNLIWELVSDIYKIIGVKKIKTSY